MGVHDLQTREIIYIIHAIVSILVAAFIIWGILRSSRINRKNKNYSKRDSRISLFTVLFLYTQLFLGIYLFFIKKSRELSQSVDVEQLINNNLFRFWTVEHLVLMLFALLISQTGHIIIEKTLNNEIKFKLRLRYYSIVAAIIVISLFFAAFKH